MKRLINTLLFATLIFCANAQNIKRPDSYNYNRGIESLQNDNIEEGIDYLNKELSENPDNGYAYTWLVSG